jgi:hypothetical protein
MRDIGLYLIKHALQIRIGGGDPEALGKLLGHQRLGVTYGLEIVSCYVLNVCGVLLGNPAASDDNDVHDSLLLWRAYWKYRAAPCGKVTWGCHPVNSLSLWFEYLFPFQ